MNNLINYTYNHSIDVINSYSNALDLEAELIRWLTELFNLNAAEIPNLSPYLLNYIQKKYEENNILSALGSRNKFKITSEANIYNTALAKTNQFLKNIRRLKKDSNDVEILKRYSNLVLSTQQAVEENHINHTTENVNNVAGVGHPQTLLLYVSERDSNVRHNHKLADNTCLPKSDKFWNSAFKLLGEFNCRCSIIEAPQGRDRSLRPNITIKESNLNPADIDLEEGKAILFKESLPMFEGLDPIVRRQFKKVGF